MGKGWRKDKRFKTRKKLSVHKVAKMIGISGNYLSLIEKALNAPSDNVLMAIAGYFDIDEDTLFCLYGRTSPKQMKWINENPELNKTLRMITTDKRLSEKEKSIYLID